MLEYTPLLGLILPKIQNSLNECISEEGVKFWRIKFSAKETRIFIAYMLSFFVALFTVLLAVPPTWQEFLINGGMYLGEAFALSQAAYYLYFRKAPKGLKEEGQPLG